MNDQTLHACRLKLLRNNSDFIVKNLSVDDYAPAEQLLTNFADLYRTEWVYAMEALRSVWSEERRILSVLFTVVRVRKIGVYRTKVSLPLLQGRSNVPPLIYHPRHSYPHTKVTPNESSPGHLLSYFC